MRTSNPNRYAQIIERIFHDRYTAGATEVAFQREDIITTAASIGITLPLNLGDVIYSFRYRAALPASIQNLATSGKGWVISPAGRSRYKFSLKPLWELVPSPARAAIKIPDATPGIVACYSLSDEQALLVRLRYNRLLDIFTGLTCYSLQNHLRTTVPNMGQVETDEIYVGLDRNGTHFVLPVQAKGGNDAHNVVQIEQDFALCAAKFPNLICRAIGAQFMANGVIALFELQNISGEISLRHEEHYQLVSPDEISDEELAAYRGRSES